MKSRLVPFQKVATGIQGLDEITGGGFPAGRSTLLCGGPGCGKTFLALQFLVHGAMACQEPGVFIGFEETRSDLINNVASLGFRLGDLIARKKVAIDHVRLERSEFEETGDYSLDGLFLRLQHAIDSVKAKRVVLDSIELVFAGLSQESVVRAELHRLLRWLKEKGLTAVITSERGASTLTRHGIEEYACDCVVSLDHRVVGQVATRRLRVVKYRGSTHGTNEYPFLISNEGVAVLPVTSLGLHYRASQERLSSGIPRLDTMLGGRGYFRGSSILISGTAGSGKTSLAAFMADAACRRGEKCLFCCFEESPEQLMRNMRSIGVNLRPWLSQKLLDFQAVRPSLYGLEMHLANTLQHIHDFQPRLVVLDPITAFSDRENSMEVQAMLVRLLDHLKNAGMTALLTNLDHNGAEQKGTESAISSIIDSWLMLADVEVDGERNHIMRILKSRGMAHSNQLREYRITSRGIQLEDVYLGAKGVLTGSARQVQEARDVADRLEREQEAARQQRALEHRRRAMESQVAALRANFAVEKTEAERALRSLQDRERRLLRGRKEQARRRWADSRGH